MNDMFVLIYPLALPAVSSSAGCCEAVTKLRMRLGRSLVSSPLARCGHEAVSHARRSGTAPPHLHTTDAGQLALACRVVRPRRSSAERHSASSAPPAAFPDLFLSVVRFSPSLSGNAALVRGGCVAVGHHRVRQEQDICPTGLSGHEAEIDINGRKAANGYDCTFSAASNMQSLPCRHPPARSAHFPLSANLVQMISRWRLLTWDTRTSSLPYPMYG